MHVDRAREVFTQNVQRASADRFDAVGLLRGEYGKVAGRLAGQAMTLFVAGEQNLAYRYVRAALVVAEHHMEGDLFGFPFGKGDPLEDGDEED